MQFLLILALLVLPSSAFANAFSDVPESAREFEAIEYVHQEGIVSGYPDGTYKPASTVNRAELVKIIVGSLFDNSEIEECDTASLTLSDVPQDVWYKPYLCVAMQNGIISGYADGTFHGERTVNLAEASKIIVTGFYEDTGTSDNGEVWFARYLHVLAEQQALPTSLNGADSGLRRGQLAEIIFRIDTGIDTLPSLQAADFGITQANGGTDDGDFSMSATDCLEGEQYDEREEVCYVEIDCETEEECQQKLAELDEEADFIDEAGNDYAELDPESDVTKATYTIAGDKISLLDNKVTPSDDGRYRAIWQHFITLMPEAARSTLTQFEISSDGKEGTLAAVYPSDKNPAQWTLVVDDIDAYDDRGALDTRELTYSLIHEVGHLLSLNANEVPPMENIDPENRDEFIAARKKCLPRFFTGEGCSTAESAINRFFQVFWKELYAEYADALDGLTEEDVSAELYANNPTAYVSDYAATNPAEDFAESWTEFVLNDRQKNPQSTAEQKKDFFYNYPSLVSLRSVIRQRLPAVPRP